MIANGYPQHTVGAEQRPVGHHWHGGGERGRHGAVAVRPPSPVAGVLSAPVVAAAPKDRPAYLGSVILALAGATGIASLLLSWTSIVFSVDLPADGPRTGWQIFRTARAGASFSTTWAIGAYSVLAVGLIGGALVVFAVVVLCPVDHRPLGAAALVLSCVAAAGAVFWVVRARNLTDHDPGAVFAHAGPGWYAFLASGLLGLLGSLVVLSRG